MMWFHFFTGNQLGGNTLLDMMEWLTAGLTDLKHEVTVGNTIAPNAMNLIWENFYDGDERIFEEQTFQFGLIATEIPTGQTYNWLEQDPWLARRRNFERIAPRAEFIWSMIEEPVAQYWQWAPAGFLELGFSEKLLDPVFGEEPMFDFGFYGLHIAPYRSRMLERLKTRCAVVTPGRFLTGRELNTFIASAKISLCLKHMPQWPVPSPARLSRVLHSKRGIAAEYVPVRTGPSAFVPIARKDQDFTEFCLECLHGPWKQSAEDAYDRFRAAMPMKRIMERLLDETRLTSRRPSPPPCDDGLREWIRFQGGEPRLVDSRSGFNFVQYKDHIYAIKQSCGPLDVAVEASTLLERFGPEAIIISPTLKEAQTQVEALAPQPRGLGPAPSPPRRAVLVLGMHRSGTSALTGVIAMLGVAGPKTLHAPDQWNPRGYFESPRIFDVHDKLLAALGSRWDDWRELDPQRFHDFEPHRQELKQLLIDEFGGPPLMYIKDPRICRFVPFIRSILMELGYDTVAVMPVRNPLEVANSLRRRENFAVSKSILLWLRHVLDAEHDTRCMPRCILPYEGLLDDWRGQMQRVAAQTAIQWPDWSEGAGAEIDAFLSSDLRRERLSSGSMKDRSAPTELAETTYEILLDIAGHGERQEHRDRLDTLRSRLDDACRFYVTDVKGTNDHPEAERDAIAAICDRLMAECAGRRDKNQAAP